MKRSKVATSDRRLVSSQLREAILANGQTAYRLGQLAEVNPGMIQRFLNGERGLTSDTIDRLSLAIGLRLVETGRGRGRPAKPRPVGPESGSIDIASVPAPPAALRADPAPIEEPGNSITDPEPSNQVEPETTGYADPQPQPVHDFLGRLFGPLNNSNGGASGPPPV